MKLLNTIRLLTWLIAFNSITSLAQHERHTDKPLPQPLKDWVTWTMWDESSAPSLFDQANKKITLWPSKLNLQADTQGGSFQIAARAFEDSWMRLPGSQENWPLKATINGSTVPVLEKNGFPVVFLKAGSWNIQGSFQWNQMPQFIMIPHTIGILSLTKHDLPVDTPSRDRTGKLWLKRTNEQSTTKDYLEINLYRNLQDGHL